MSKPKYTANYNGVEYTDALAGVEIPVYNEGARVSFKRMTYVVPAGNITASKTIALGIVPKNARVIAGAYQTSAMGVGRTMNIGLAGADGSGYLDTGVADATNMFVNAANVSGSGQAAFATLSAGNSNALYLTAKDCILVAVTGGNTFPAAGTITVTIEYVVD